MEGKGLPPPSPAEKGKKDGEPSIVEVMGGEKREVK